MTDKASKTVSFYDFAEACVDFVDMQTAKGDKIKVDFVRSGEWYAIFEAPDPYGKLSFMEMYRPSGSVPTVDKLKKLWRKERDARIKIHSKTKVFGRAA